MRATGRVAVADFEDDLGDAAPGATAEFGPPGLP